MQKYVKYPKELDGRSSRGKNKRKKVNGKYSKEDWNEIMKEYRQKKRLLGYAVSLTK